MNTTTAKGLTACQTSFNIQMGLDLQQQDLANWKAALSTECFSALLKETARRNSLLRSEHHGHDVFHSIPMLQWVNVWRPVPVDPVEDWPNTHGRRVNHAGEAY